MSGISGVVLHLVGTVVEGRVDSIGKVDFAD